MYVNLRVFLISPDKVVVYAFDNSENNDNYIYNGGSLELIVNPEISGYTEIAGSSTPDFKTNPVVLGYANGLFEIVYAPQNMQTIFLTDGSPAQHGGIPIIAKSVLKIPNIEECDAGPNAYTLTSFELDDPNMKSIQEYITMAKNNQEYQTSESYWELRSKTSEKSLPDLTLNKVPAPPLPENMPQIVQAKNPSTPVLEDPIQASPTIVTQNPTEEQWYQDLQNQINQLKTERDELHTILEKISRRLYKIYPVPMPKEIKIGDQMGEVVSVSEIQEKMGNGEIERMILEPILQAYAGSHRGDNRLLTFYAKDGNIYHVRAKYDIKNNKFEEPE